MPPVSKLFRLGAAAAVVLAAPAAAQAPPPLTAAAETITADDLSDRLHLIAHDSMGGRDTPSPGLEKTAEYIARQFQAFGLQPGGDGGTYFQRYAIVRRKLDLAASHVAFSFGKVHAQAALDRDARYAAFGGIPAKPLSAPAYLVGGTVDAVALKDLPVKGKIVLVVLDLTRPLPPAAQGASSVLLRQAGAAGLVLVSNRDSAAFAQRLRSQPVNRLSVGGDDRSPSPVVEVHERALSEIARLAHLDFGAIRNAATAVTREVPGLQVTFDFKEEVVDSAQAPNVVGILEGTDPKLRHEYLVYSAHMDHVGTAPSPGCSARGADSICNGADDDGSGTVSIVELAQAFTQAGARPRRSIIFLTVSGEEKGLWGSDYFATHPPVPLAQVVADLNIDMIGRNWRDTIVAIGKEHSDLGATLQRVAAAHPELGLAAIDDLWPEERFYYRSDHYNFARRGVPILFFFSGVHPDYHQVTDSPDKIDYEKTARIVRLLFYLGQEIANAPERPQWNPASYQEIVGK
ncbi:MAG TPA: M28 family peptidase [Gemmatimonadales bacterium]|nr:M28 family peptidase [Gemmatimonadales bacterium]